MRRGSRSSPQPVQPHAGSRSACGACVRGRAGAAMGVVVCASMRDGRASTDRRRQRQRQRQSGDSPVEASMCSVRGDLIMLIAASSCSLRASADTFTHTHAHTPQAQTNDDSRRLTQPANRSQPQPQPPPLLPPRRSHHGRRIEKERLPESGERCR